MRVMQQEGMTVLEYDILYLVLGRSRWLVANTCKISFLVEVGTLRFFNKYLLKRENTIIFWREML
jgi:hypothetical protein